MIDHGSDSDYWAGQIALVTGSTRGLGHAYAQHLLDLGCRVVVNGRSQRSAEEGLTALTGSAGRACAVGFDVADAEQVRAGVAQVRDRMGEPTILVNNAGNQSRAPFDEIRHQDWDAVVRCHLDGAFRVSREVVPGMVARGFGKILHIGSVTTVAARSTIAPYAAAKGGLLMLTRSMTADLACHGIQVNMVSPGYFRTEMNAALTADPEFSAWVAERTPSGRWGEVPELLGAVEFLCGPHSTFVNGQNLCVDGGMTATL